MGAITFNYEDWCLRFPEFKQISPQLAQRYFDDAGDLWPNTQSNPSFGAGSLNRLLELLTAHIAKLNAPLDGEPASDVVGRISSASEGSVSVSTDLNSSGSPSEAWFTQTRYGFQFWQATAQYRTGVYVARPTRVPSAIFPIRPFWGR